MKGKVRFGKKGKLSPPYLGPYEIIQRVGKFAFERRFPRDLTSFHLVFHVSMLKNYIVGPESILPIEVMV